MTTPVGICEACWFLCGRDAVSSASLDDCVADHVVTNRVGDWRSHVTSEHVVDRENVLLIEKVTAIAFRVAKAQMFGDDP